MPKQKVKTQGRALPKVPKSRLWNLAKKIATMPKDTEALYNSLKAVYADGFGDGYDRNTDDRRHFKEAREAERRKSFNSFKDTLDDLIHEKNQNNR